MSEKKFVIYVIDGDVHRPATPEEMRMIFGSGPSMWAALLVPVVMFAAIAVALIVKWATA